MKRPLPPGGLAVLAKPVAALVLMSGLCVGAHAAIFGDDFPT